MHYSIVSTMNHNNPLRYKLKDHQLILASGSPRRKQLLEAMGLDFVVQSQSVAEVYPESLQHQDIPMYLAKLKAVPFSENLQQNQIILTADTVVWHNGTSLTKPNHKAAAFNMLSNLSGDWHEVITAVCITTSHTQQTVVETTRVKCDAFTDDIIQCYIETHHPFDKAGGYGIQEWIGLVGITEIQGSYTNVVGLPTQLVYKTLMELTV